MGIRSWMPLGSLVAIFLLCPNTSWALSVGEAKGFLAKRQVDVTPEALFEQVMAKGDTSEVVELLLDAGVNPNARDEKGETVLERAVWRGKKDIARLLLDRGAEVNGRNSDGETSLFAARNRGDRDMAAFLLDRKADVNARNKNGQTVLHLSAGSCSYQTFQLLVEVFLERGADPNVRDVDGDSPLYAAASTGEHDLATLLVKRGGDPSAPNSK